MCPSSRKTQCNHIAGHLNHKFFNINPTTVTMPCTQAYIEMMRGRRGDRRCRKCGWFGHLARHCRQKEILAERKRKSVLVTSREQQQCRTRRDLWRGLEKGVATRRLGCLMRTRRVLLVFTLAIYTEYLSGRHMYL